MSFGEIVDETYEIKGFISRMETLAKDYVISITSEVIYVPISKQLEIQ